MRRLRTLRWCPGSLESHLALVLLSMMSLVALQKREEMQSKSRLGTQLACMNLHPKPALALPSA